MRESFARWEGRPAAQLSSRRLSVMALVFCPCVGPVEPALLQPPVIEPETVGLPVQDLEFVPPPVAENEQALGEGIKAEGFADHERQPVDGLAHIRGTGGKVDVDVGGITDHTASRTRMTRCKASALKPEDNSMRYPAGRLSVEYCSVPRPEVPTHLQAGLEAGM